MGLPPYALAPLGPMCRVPLVHAAAWHRDWFTPLMHAALFDRAIAVELLVRMGADVNAQGNDK